MSFRLTGNGPITVVITQGLGPASAEWWPIQDKVSGMARVLTWDRPGYGDSSPAHTPRTASNIDREALDLLGAVAPDGPLVLVGHSQGGLYTNALARLAGMRVKGVVLLDPASPDNGRLRRGLPPMVFQRSRSDLSVGLRIGRRMARLHLMGLLKPLMAKQPPPCGVSSPRFRRTTWPSRNIWSSSCELGRAISTPSARSLGSARRAAARPGADDRPVREVLAHGARRCRAGRGPVGEVAWRVRVLSPLGTVETVTGSGQLIHLEKPDVIVAKIGEVMEASVTVH